MACTVGHRLQDHLDEVPTGTCGFFIPQPQWSGSYKSRDRGISSSSLNRRGNRAHLHPA
ncbi:MAG: hypothetical protein QOF56_4384 [Acidobacteriaceae bacterium]|jgi:hypothetical protein|nr:hypothetical protein [Acidobacteriaceae bacterium]